MGEYVKPTVEKLSTAINEQVKEEVAQPVGGTPVNVTAVDIYKEAIDNFRKFINGEIYNGDLEERKKFQRSFITSVWGMLELNDAQVKEVLDYFIKTINDFPGIFEYNKIAAPLFTIESTLAASEVKRYTRFLVFITLFAENARNRELFRSQFDMPKFEQLFSPVAKQRLHNYVYR